MNEIWISLIACSRGTVGEKATALFNIYSYTYPYQAESMLAHRTTVSRLARSITKAGEAAGMVERNVAPPTDPSEQAQQALRLTVFSNYPRKNTLVGYVFIPSMGPYISQDTTEAHDYNWNIWGQTP